MAYSHHRRASVLLLGSQPSQPLLDVSGVLADRLQGTADVLVYLMAAMASSPDRQLHDGCLKGKLVLVDSFQGVRSEYSGDGIAWSRVDGMESIAASKKKARLFAGLKGILQRSRGSLDPVLSIPSEKDVAKAECPCSAGFCDWSLSFATQSLPSRYTKNMT